MINLTIRIGNCFSGVLCAPAQGAVSRVALATERALTTFTSLPHLVEEVQYHIDSEKLADGRRDIDAAMRENGLSSKFYDTRRDWIVFGIRLFNEGSNDLADAENRIVSMGTGIHRRVFFGIKGIKTGAELADLPNNLYAAMLAKISENFHDPGMARIREIKISDDPFDNVGTSGNGMKITFSRRLLESFPRWAHIEAKEL